MLGHCKSIMAEMLTTSVLMVSIASTTSLNTGIDQKDSNGVSIIFVITLLHGQENNTAQPKNR